MFSSLVSPSGLSITFFVGGAVVVGGTVLIVVGRGVVGTISMQINIPCNYFEGHRDMHDEERPRRKSEIRQCGQDSVV